VAWLERAFGLVRFEERAGVPAWARALRRVVTLHGMHWTGRIFLDFARLCDGARALGVHLMPMFGANCANAWLPRVRGFDAAARMKSATGNRFHGNVPDWDLSRVHDTGWQAWLNPGHPGWHDELAGQVESLAGRFGFDAVFLDTTEVWTNDRDHAVFAGANSGGVQTGSTTVGSPLVHIRPTGVGVPASMPQRAVRMFSQVPFDLQHPARGRALREPAAPAMGRSRARPDGASPWEARSPSGGDQTATAPEAVPAVSPRGRVAKTSQ
jgi:hypothetical protein